MMMDEKWAYIPKEDMKEAYCEFFERETLKNGDPD